MEIRSTSEAKAFAELAARTGLEPELAARYAEEPARVLLEFGLSSAEPLYAASSVQLEDLSRSDAAAPVLGCWTVTPTALERPEETAAVHPQGA